MIIGGQCLCLNCLHPAQIHSRDVGCLSCRCLWVYVSDGHTQNPLSKYAKKEN